MAVTIVQSPGGNASSANSPTSLVVSWASTVAGNYLVLFASVTGSASPTITTPGGWTVLASIPGTNISAYIYVLPNNAGGLTGLTLSCSATNGGISAAFFEVGGMGASPATEYTNTFSGNGTSVPQLITDTVLQTNELFLAFVASNATGTLSTAASRTPEWAGNINGIGSTTATTNTRNNTYWATNGSSSSTPQIQGTLSPGVIWAAIGAHIKSATSGPFSTPVLAVVSGNAGQMIPGFYQGNIGG